MSGELAFSSTELAEFQATQNAHMMDSCVIQTWSAGTADGWNTPSNSYADGSEIYCGYDDLSVGETGDDSEAAEVDAKVRLPIGNAITTMDRVKLTKRHGVAITAVYFEVLGVERGPSGLVAKLKKLMDGTET